MIQTAVNAFILPGLVLEAALLIIIFGSGVYTAFLHFTADPGHITIFVVIEVLNDLIVFMKKLAFFKLIVKN